VSIAKWDDSFKTGYEPVDEQHTNLFAMVNTLHDAIVAGKGTDALAPALQKLAHSTIEHFAEEEKLMTSINYPGFPAHKAKHRDLTHQVEELLAKFREGKLVLSVTISTFLANWLRHHIKEDDFALIKYLKEHPLQKPATASH